MTYLELALRDGHAEIVGEGKQQKVVYKAVDHIERYADPEEQVRAEFWAELIYGNPSIMSKVEKILQNCPQYLPLESKNISLTKIKVFKSRSTQPIYILFCRLLVADKS